MSLSTSEILVQYHQHVLLCKKQYKTSMESILPRLRENAGSDQWNERLDDILAFHKQEMGDTNHKINQLEECVSMLIEKFKKKTIDSESSHSHCADKSTDNACSDSSALFENENVELKPGTPLKSVNNEEFPSQETSARSETTGELPRSCGEVLRGAQLPTVAIPGLRQGHQDVLAAEMRSLTLKEATILYGFDYQQNGHAGPSTTSRLASGSSIRPSSGLEGNTRSLDRPVFRRRPPTPYKDRRLARRQGTPY